MVVVPLPSHNLLSDSQVPAVYRLNGVVCVCVGCMCDCVCGYNLRPLVCRSDAFDAATSQTIHLSLLSPYVQCLSNNQYFCLNPRNSIKQCSRIMKLFLFTRSASRPCSSTVAEFIPNGLFYPLIHMMSTYVVIFNHYY